MGLTASTPKDCAHCCTPMQILAKNKQINVQTHSLMCNVSIHISLLRCPDIDSINRYLLELKETFLSMLQISAADSQGE